VETEFIAVFCTHPDAAAAGELGGALVDAKLAACVNVVSGLSSLYVWQGRRETSAEVLLLLKTRAALFTRLSAAIRAHHPYSTPEIVALPIVAGEPEYLAWLRASTHND
jgi:periplasmic divalent cation tolerance protein